MQQGCDGFEFDVRRSADGQPVICHDATIGGMKIDAATRSIIAHTAPVKPKTFNDMEEAARAMKEQDSRRDSIFRQSMEAQKHASELLEKKFQEAVKKAKETPDTGKPIRDFDLD